MGEKMGNAPVYFTLAQVRFNTILNLENYLPAIQDKMREEHFPDYKMEVLQRVVVPFNRDEGAQESAPSISPQTRYIFGDIDKTSGFVLDSSALSFQTTNYDTFETFSESFLMGLRILHEALHFDFTERVGLRYLDAVLPNSESESLSEYLVPEVIGLSQKSNGELVHSFSETVSIHSAGQLVSRVIVQNGKVGLPPELATLSPNINSRFTASNGEHAILDNDAFHEQREAFELSSLEKRLSALHDEILNSFRMTVTEHAVNTWK